MSRVTFDIETVPIQLDTLPAPLQVEHERRRSRRAEKDLDPMAHDFHPAFNKIVSIALRISDEKYGIDKHDSVIDRVYSGPDEKEILTKFLTVMSMLKAPLPTYVGWNQLAFDVPIIIFRTMANQLAAPSDKLAWINFVNTARFRTTPHYDIMMQLATWNMSLASSMRMAAVSFGLEDPKAKTHGGDVEELVKQGDFARIGEYCASDVNITDQLYVPVRRILG